MISIIQEFTYIKNSTTQITGLPTFEDLTFKHSIFRYPYVHKIFCPPSHIFPTFKRYRVKVSHLNLNQGSEGERAKQYRRLQCGGGRGEGGRGGKGLDWGEKDISRRSKHSRHFEKMKEGSLRTVLYSRRPHVGVNPWWCWILEYPKCCCTRFIQLTPSIHALSHLRRTERPQSPRIRG